MLHLGEVKKEETIEFSWGRKIQTGGLNKDGQLFESFTYDGVEYFLYDAVCFWGDDDQADPHIGKLIKIWETSSQQKKVEVVWFFRPFEIHDFLRDVPPLKNEIFLASGEGKGLFNHNPLEAICGKCNVICTSKDKRNPQASEKELRLAEYIFYRTFDVGSFRISDSFPNIIAGTKVEHFFNQEKGRKLVTLPGLKIKLKEKPETSVPKKVVTESKILAATSGKQTCFSDENTEQKPKPSIGKDGRGAVKVSFSPVKDRAKVKFSEDLSTSSVSDIQPLKKRKLEGFSVGSKKQPAKLSEPLPRSLNYQAKFLDSKAAVSENRELSKGNYVEKTSYISDEAAAQLKLDKGFKTKTQIVEVTRRPDVDTSKWFKQQSWEDRTQRACEKGTLVLLENLDPSYTSSEVQDIVWHAFNAKVDAKMLPLSTFSSPHYGKAFVIFKSKDAAEFAISELKRKCLMLANGRPVVARRWTPREPCTPTKFVGHLIIDKARLQKQREDVKKAVSTSHYSQPNTIEYEMAIEWRALQEKSDIWRKALNEQQAKEIEGVRSQLKMIHYK